MQYDKDRMERSQLYVDRAVRWINESGRFACAIPSFGFPDQGDAISWKVWEDEQKYSFRTIDVKEAHAWVEDKPPESWGGLMLAKKGQLHGSWIYIVINQPMTMLALIDMEKCHIPSVAEEVVTSHPEGGEQISMRIPFSHFKFVRLS
jgi:hypothetical protein